MIIPPTPYVGKNLGKRKVELESNDLSIVIAKEKKNIGTIK